MVIKKDKQRVYYYSDELNDDFGNVTFKEKYILPNDYNYKRNWIQQIFGPIIFWGLCHTILTGYCIFNGTKVKGRENVKAFYKVCKEMDTGGFIYGNHTANQDAFDIQALVIRRKMVNVIANPDMLSSKFLGAIVKMLGLIPLATSVKGQANMMKGMEYYLKKKKQSIIIYPEAHIWPYYTKIRPLRVATLHYPAKFNTPILPVVTCYRKPRRKNGKPKRTLIVGKPIAPLKDKSSIENKKYLWEELTKQMNEISSSFPQYEYIKYIKVDKDNNL